MSPPLRVLIVDDSATARLALRAALQSDPGLEVVGEAADGRSARTLIATLSPDLITMDLFLRAESGLDVTRAIMASHPIPIILVTAANPKAPELIFRAMQAGVLDIQSKLPAPSHPDYAERRAHLIRTLRTLATVPLVKRRRAPQGAPPRRHTSSIPAPASAGTQPAFSPPRPAELVPELLLIGASTGGPPLLASLLSQLEKPFPVPILLVQHIASGFLAGFVAWLEQCAGLPCRTVEGSLELSSGCVYVAAEEHHLVVEGDRRVSASSAAPRGYHRPSVDILFESAVAARRGPSSVAVLLTGMGRDGAEGLRALRAAGARTIVQSPRSSVVASMPAQAIELRAALEIVDAPDLPRAIAAHLSVGRDLPGT